MSDVRDIIKSKMIGQERSKEDKTDELKRDVEHIKTVREAQQVAGELAGLPGKEKQLDEQRSRAEKAEAELHKQGEQTLKDKMDALTQEMRESKGKTTEEVARLQAKLEETKEQLHQQERHELENKLAELKDIQTKGGDISSRIQQAKEDAKALGMTEDKASGIPPEIALEIKKMDNNLQIQLEEMRDDRDRRDKDWQLTLRKWDEEKLMRQQELDAKITMEREKLNTLTTIGTRVVGAFLEGDMGGSEEAPAIASKPEKKYTIDAGEGDEGEFNCPKCNSIVGIAVDTITAVCAGCGMSFPIRRVMSKGKTQRMPATQSKTQSKGEQIGQEESPESNSEHTGAAA